ncbi:hypothetical protein EZV62_004549 [Acer yangbiense]|uniref:Uncharacterized protein n=1 Tax=Acer yangbiense TaxID=1000413 RepID=A0A5C7IL78_9ROSI|nr:hypothetical protein EZV62_004549 [Acer yangbiense]
MGQGQEHKTRTDPQLEIQERGEIFFFYRPKVGKEEAHSAEDVQRLYLVLRPESGERSVEEKQHPESGKEGLKTGKSDSQGKKHAAEGGHGSQEVNIEKEPLLRFIVMGKKSLPDPSKKLRPYWGFVEMVTTKIQDVKAALGAEDKENEPQESLNIEREGSFLLQIKNPDQHGGGSSSQFRGLQNKRKAVFPAHLQGQFGPKRYCPADPTDFLNHEGCEFLLISASDDIEKELGLELETEEGEADESCSDLVKTFGETASTKPLHQVILGENSCGRLEALSKIQGLVSLSLRCAILVELFWLHAQALTLAALAGAAVVEYYDHKSGTKADRYAKYLPADSYSHKE